ncbi:MAG: hypothetical protein F6K09_11185, partial [Merismopedia sp. SIO2A8]|nr:hypothetical protein [Merismopedia sp. SIO2A8]
MTQSPQSDHQLSEMRSPENSGGQRGFSRRAFLGFGAATAALFASPDTAQAAGGKGSSGYGGLGSGGKRAAKLPPRIAYSPAAVAVPQNGTLTLDLHARQRPVTYETAQGNQTFTTRVYEEIPGPTMMVNPGDKLKITLYN